MRPSIPHWWRIDSYFHLLVFPWWAGKLVAFPQAGFDAAVAYMMHRGQGSPSGTFTQGIGRSQVPCEASRWRVWGLAQQPGAACLGKDQGCSFIPADRLRAFQGSSCADPLVSSCWSHCREQSQQSCHPPVWGRGCFLSAAAWALSIGSSETTVWEVGLCVQCPSHGIFVPDSGLALCQRISPAFSLLLFRAEGSALHISWWGGEGRTSQILNRHYLLAGSIQCA